MLLFYADTSALAKLVLDEPESDALRAFLAGADIVSCELALAELPCAVRRAASYDPELPLEILLSRSCDVLQAIALLPLDHARAAGGSRSRRCARSTRSTSRPPARSRRPMGS